MAHLSPGTGFLSLPRELRDHIYHYATAQRWKSINAARIVPPPSPDDENGGNLYFWREHRKWQRIALLGVNKQIRSEVLDFIEDQHKTQSLRLELDIKIRGHVHIPTWTYLNYALRPHDRINELKVNMTITSTEGFRRNDGWPRQPGQSFRALLNFLNRFLFKGPSFLDEEAGFITPGPHFIEKLVLDVGFQDDYTKATWPETVQEIFIMAKYLAFLDTAGKYFGKVLVRTEYVTGAEEVQKEREWNVCEQENARWKEEEWSEHGFHFGESWLEKTSGGEGIDR